MPIPFDEWTLADAQQVVHLPKDEAQRLQSYRAFMEGDHWQDWAGWTGPQPNPLDPQFEVLRGEVVRGFISRGVVREVIDRHVNGVLGRDIQWKVSVRRPLEEGETPTSEEQVRIDEATLLLQGWVEDRRLQQTYDELGRTLLYAGTAYQRLFVTPSAITEDGYLTLGTIEDIFANIHVNFLHPGEAALYTDPRTQRQVGVYLYKEQLSNRPSEAHGSEGDDRAELSYLDGDLTVIRLLPADDANQEISSLAQTEGGVASATDSVYLLNLGGRLLLHRLQRSALITEQVISQQKLLNKTLSMKGRNMDMAGFRERVVTNAQMGGSYQENADGTRTFVPHALPAGPSSMTNLTGYVLRDKDGNETALVTPGFQALDPVPVDTFLQTEQSAYEAILAEVNQLHYAMSNDATASGVSRETAMAAYLIDLLQTKQQVDQGFAWLLETTLTLAASLAGGAERYLDLRVVAEASVDPGPISPQMIQVILDLWREEKLTLRTGLSWIGVEDVDGEIAGLSVEAAERREQFPETSADERQFGQDFWNELTRQER